VLVSVGLEHWFFQGIGELILDDPEAEFKGLVTAVGEEGHRRHPIARKALATLAEAGVSSGHVAGVPPPAVLLSGSPQSEGPLRNSGRNATHADGSALPKSGIRPAHGAN